VDSPNFFDRLRRNSRDQKPQEFKTSRIDLLREEAGHRPEEVERAANEVRVEPDPAAVEAEVGRPGEAAKGHRRELVAGTIHVQFLPTDEPFGMSQNDGTDCETSETELVGHEDLTSPTDGLAAMAHAELGSDDQDVALLRFGDQTDIGLRESGKELTEENERRYRETLRKELGMAAYAIRIKPRIDTTLKKSNMVVLDGLYSHEEYVYLDKLYHGLLLFRQHINILLNFFFL